MRNHPPSAPNPEEGLRVGEQLAQVRKKRTLSLDDIVASTKIARATLEALEAMDYGRLPADPFIRGHIIVYATLLGLDGRQIADRFFQERDNGDPLNLHEELLGRDQQGMSAEKLAKPSHLSSATLAATLLVCIVCSFAAFCLYYSWNPFVYYTGRANNLALAQKPTFHPADPATSSGGRQNSLKVQAFFRLDERVLVSMDNEPMTEQHFAKGATILWEAKKQLTLQFSEPECALLYINGSPLAFPGGSDGQYTLHLSAPPSPAL